MARVTHLWLVLCTNRCACEQSASRAWMFWIFMQLDLDLFTWQCNFHHVPPNSPHVHIWFINCNRPLKKEMMISFVSVQQQKKFLGSENCISICPPQIEISVKKYLAEKVPEQTLKQTFKSQKYVLLTCLYVSLVTKTTFVLFSCT